MGKFNQKIIQLSYIFHTRSLEWQHILKNHKKYKTGSILQSHFSLAKACHTLSKYDDWKLKNQLP